MNESSKGVDPFAQSKVMQKELWAGFAINEMFTTPPAAALVKFSGGNTSPVCNVRRLSGIALRGRLW